VEQQGLDDGRGLMGSHWVEELSDAMVASLAVLVRVFASI
jgi:hypothetical protein